MVAGPGEPGVAPPGEWQQISIFLSPLDVHINRTPVRRRGHARSRTRPGKFLAGVRRPRRRRERAQRALDSVGRPHGRVPPGRRRPRAARRLPRRRSATSCVAGERFGLMKFGSRMDVFVPPGVPARRSGRAIVVRGGRERASPAGRRPEGKIGAMINVLRRRDPEQRRLRRGMYLLPSLFTMANMFCGYACVVYAMRGRVLHGRPVHRRRRRARHARRTHRAADGQHQRVRPASSTRWPTSSRSASRPAILGFAWGLYTFGRLGWAAGFLFVVGGRHPPRALQHPDRRQPGDKRYFVGMPSPAAAGVPAATVFAYPLRPASGWMARPGAADAARAGGR